MSGISAWVLFVYIIKVAKQVVISSNLTESYCMLWMPVGRIFQELNWNMIDTNAKKVSMQIEITLLAM